MVLPVKFGLIGPNGSPMGWSRVTGGDVRDDLIVVDSESVTLTFEGVPNRPVPSLFRGFSAPVKLNSGATQAERLFLARHDSDPFNRWQALQDVAMELIVGDVAGRPWGKADADMLAEAYEQTLGSKTLDPAFKALALTPPSEALVARTVAENVDPDRIHEARRKLIADITGRIATALERHYLTNDSRLSFSPDAKQAGRRSLKNAVLSLLVNGGVAFADRLAREQYQAATNMTDRFAALGIVVSAWTPDALALLGDYRTMFTAEPLVFDKWLALNASAPDAATLDRVRAILADPTFPKNNPNRLRSLLGSFGANAMQFARADGEGFRFMTRCVADIDTRNPQVASRLLTAFRTWRSFEPGRREAAEAALTSLRESRTFSRNVTDILDRTLAG